MHKQIFLFVLFSLPFFGFGTPVLIDVPIVSQSTHHSCGPAALLSVLRYYGIDRFNESELMTELGTNIVDGTEIDPIVSFALKSGIFAQKKVKSTLDDLRASLKKAQPVILAIQAWPTQPKKPVEYKDEWMEGHFEVLVGMDNINAYFVDPYLVGSRGVMSLENLNLRWHDIDNKEKLDQPAIFFNGTPKPPKKWVKVR